MTGGIISSLQEDRTIKETFLTWRNIYRNDTERGTLEILQLCVNMTGYDYVLEQQDLEKINNIGTFVREQILKSDYHETKNFFAPTYLKKLFQFLQLMIAQERQELLQNNIWLNRLSRLLVGLSEVANDECRIVSGYLSTAILVNLSVVREHLEKNLDRVQLEEAGDLQEIEIALKRDCYVRKMSKLLVRNIEAGCSYAATLPTIADLLCHMLEDHPAIYVSEQNVLNLLTILLQHKNSKVFHAVANCLKCLLNQETQSLEVVETVAKFFIDTLGKRFIQAMLTYKSSERIAMEVIVSVQRRNCGGSIFEEHITEKIRQQLFSEDEVVRGFAIDFHAYTLYQSDVDEQSNNKEILLHILMLYERYEHSPSALRVLIEDLWIMKFFDDWQMLFNLLNEETAREDNLFKIMAIVQIINQCYALLMRDLNPDNGSKSENTDYCYLHSLLKSFMHYYPRALRKCASHDHAVIMLLQSAHGKHHRGLQQCNVEVDQYYEDLFGALEMMAQNKTGFYALHKCLIVIRSYLDIVIDVEQIWSELLNKYTTDLCDTRTMITSRNIGKDTELMEKYVVCLTRLTAFLELDNNLGRHLSNISKILVNDFRLLDRMKLNRSQEGILCRLYKCIIYTLFKDRMINTDESSPSCLHPYSGRRLKGRILELLCFLIKQLRMFDEPLDNSVHMFISLCDMLVVTQTAVANSNISELHDVSYPVKPLVLEMMAKFLLNCLFSKVYDHNDAPISKQRAMFAKYIDLYLLHKSLPRITDTYYIVANYSIDSQFEQQIEQLMTVLHQTDQNQFNEVVCWAAFQLLLDYKSETSVKNFFKKFQTFATTKLPESANSIACVFEKVLDHMMGMVLDTEDPADPIRMLKLIEPMMPLIEMDDRLKIGNSLLEHPNYATIAESDRKVINRFLKHLKK
ncbi:uncharacterized protein LOC129778252 [Toxorhynchites rutilus septentrionalis]|uniref:uncharacterized protein LOC129778252 n=1 Tax=Toxorhynchites rutilus septentrionalis TaxID=329112 RepID=UPI00247936A0|nr:uncharacterized protein LOC129778252 [Toxorhynchites rutilus septentrionalis]